VQRLGAIPRLIYLSETASRHINRCSLDLKLPKLATKPWSRIRRLWRPVNGIKK
jgi:hypothetical protein